MPNFAQLTAALTTYVTAETRDAVRRVVSARPELWTDQAVVFLDMLVGRTGLEGIESFDLYARERRDLLRRCRQVGIEEAFAEPDGETSPPTDWHALLMDWLRASTWSASCDYLTAHLDLMSDAADAALGNMIAAAREQGVKDVARIAEEHRALLRRCRQVGLDAAFAELTSTPGGH